MMKGTILKNNENDYIKQITTPGSKHKDAELQSLIDDAMAKGGSGWDAIHETYSRERHEKITTRDDYTKTSEGLGQEIRDRKRANAKAKADDMFAGKK